LCYSLLIALLFHQNCLYLSMSRKNLMILKHWMIDCRCSSKTLLKSQ